MTAPVTVTTADREAAADYWQTFVARPGECIVANQTRKGGMDQGEAVQAFARHRLAAEAASAAQVAELVEANLALRNGYADAAAGLAYALQHHGRLYGVGFDRVADRFFELVTMPEREGLMAGGIARAKSASEAEGV